jgi:hypothetical protein
MSRAESNITRPTRTHRGSFTRSLDANYLFSNNDVEPSNSRLSSFIQLDETCFVPTSDPPWLARDGGRSHRGGCHHGTHGSSAAGVRAAGTAVLRRGRPLKMLTPMIVFRTSWAGTRPSSTCDLSVRRDSTVRWSGTTSRPATTGVASSARSGAAGGGCGLISFRFEPEICVGASGSEAAAQYFMSGGMSTLRSYRTERNDLNISLFQQIGCDVRNFLSVPILGD